MGLGNDGGAVRSTASFEDLVANRAGRLGAGQEASLREDSRRSRALALVRWSLVGLFSLLVAAMVASGGQVGLALAALVPVAACILLFHPWSRPLDADVRDGRVSSVLGTPSESQAESVALGLLALVAVAGSLFEGGFGWPDIRRESVVMSGVRLPVGSIPRSWLGPGIVRAYYLPRSRQIVSIERTVGNGGREPS